MRRSLLIALLVSLSISASGQSDSTVASDTASATKKRIYSRARKATILSAVIPGAGQVYNRKYWKVPIIYAGLGGIGYLYYFNNQEYRYFSSNLAALSDNDSSTKNETPYTSDQLIEIKKDYKRSRDFALIGVVAIYLLNIVDANVDAHLATFDVSDDLSLKLSPFTYSYGKGVTAGISIKLKYR